MTFNIFPSLEPFHGNQTMIKNIMMWPLKGFYTMETWKQATHAWTKLDL